MPESPVITTVVPAEIVRQFYAAVDRQDADALGDLVDSAFDDQVAVRFPESLPYGGVVTGAATVRKIFRGLASGKSPVGPRQLRVDAVVGDGDLVVAVLSFNWYAVGGSEPVPSGACETWRFEGGRVVELRAYYWDTAALVAAAS
jgi:ketosteroid isomerase-like protein